MGVVNARSPGRHERVPNWNRSFKKGREPNCPGLAVIVPGCRLFVSKRCPRLTADGAGERWLRSAATWKFSNSIVLCRHVAIQIVEKLSASFQGTKRCARLREAVRSEKVSAQAVDRWNFGLCATIPREPRQARKGATVAGQLRVPRITRSSSSRFGPGRASPT